MVSNKEFRVDIKLRNNLILKKIEELGFNKIAEFCRATGIDYQRISGFITFKEPYLDKKGQYKDRFLELCEALGCVPDDVVTQEQIDINYQSTKKQIEIGKADIARFLAPTEDEVCYIDTDMLGLPEKMEEALGSLTEREQKVIKMRFFDDMTLEAAGKQLGVGGSRLRQVEAKALRKLREHSRARLLKPFVGEEE